jgi:hypothetical protein
LAIGWRVVTLVGAGDLIKNKPSSFFLLISPHDLSNAEHLNPVASMAHAELPAGEASTRQDRLQNITPEA